MQIKRVKIENYRSLVDVDLNINSFNVMIGRNNHGKTNFFEAIEWFYTGTGDIKNIKSYRSTNKVSVTITFDGVQQGVELMKNERNKTKIKNLIGDDDEISIIRMEDDDGKKSSRKIVNNKGELIDPGTGFDSSLNDLLPKIEFIKTETSLKEVIKYGKTTQIGSMFADVLEEMLNDPEYDAFVKQFEKLFLRSNSPVSKKINEISEKVKVYLQRQFPECKDVHFEVNIPQITDLFKNFDATIDDGAVTTASEKGDGMQRALMLAIIQTYADYRKQNEEVKKMIFLIDEGELHLHPTAQRNLKDSLITLVEEGDQVFITTHSSVLITADTTNKDLQSLYKVLKDNEGITTIEKQNEDDRQDLIYTLLGGNPADLLLPRNFIIVEGPSESIFLKNILQRHYPTIRDLMIIEACGDIDQASDLINALNKLFTPLSKNIYSNRFVLLLDSHDQELEKKLNNIISDLEKTSDFKSTKQLKTLKVKTLEEYYPEAEENQIKLTNSHVYVKKWKRTYEESKNMTGKQKKKLAESVSIQITKQQFENCMPILKDTVDTANSLGF